MKRATRSKGEAAMMVERAFVIWDLIEAAMDRMALIISVRQPGNRRRAHIVAAPYLGKRFLAPVAALDRLFLLMRGELRRSAHFLPARHGTRSTFAGARPD